MEPLENLDPGVRAAAEWAFEHYAKAIETLAF